MTQPKVMYNVRKVAIAAAVLFSCAVSAWAGECTVNWYTYSSGLQNDYMKNDYATGTYTVSNLVDHTVYLLTAVNGTGDYGSDTSGARALFNALRNGTLTVADVRANAFSSAQTGEKGFFDTVTTTITLTSKTNFYICAFSDDEQYVYFGTARGVSENTTTTSLSWTFAHSYMGDKAVTGGTTTSSQSGWYKIKANPRYAKWSVTGTESPSKGLQDPTLTKTLKDYPVYLFGAKYGSGDFGTVGVDGANDIYDKMKNNGLTVYDVEKLAAGSAHTTEKGYIGETLVQLGDTGETTNIFMVTFSPDYSYAYFGKAMSLSPTRVGASATFTKQFIAERWDAKTAIDWSGWYKTPKTAYLTVKVEPAKTNNMTAAIIGVESMDAPGATGDFMVLSNRTFDIVYTPTSGYVFSDNTYAKTNVSFTSDHSPVKDPYDQFDIVPAKYRIGTRGFLTFESAVADARTDETITLLDDATWEPSTCSVGRFKVDPGEYAFSYTLPYGIRIDIKDGLYCVEGDYFEVMHLEGLGVVTTNKFMYLTNVLAETGGTFDSATNLFLLRDVTLTENAVVRRSVWYTGDTNILTAVGFTFENDAILTIKGGLIDFPYQANIVLEGGRFCSSNTSYKDKTTGWATKYKPTGYSYQTLNPTVRSYDKQFMTTPASGQAIYPVVDSKGRSVTAVLNSTWVSNLGTSTTAANRSTQFSTVQANGLTFLENAILGFTSKWGESVSADDRPVAKPVQTTNADKIALRLGCKMAFDSKGASKSGATVKYRVFSSDTPGGKDGDVSAVTTYSGNETVEMDLPKSGVKYYIIDAEVQTVE